MTTVMSPKAIARAQAGPAAEGGYARAEAAKLKRDRQSYAEFRAADQREHERLRELYMTRLVKAAETEVRLRRIDREALEEYAAEKLAAYRALADKSRAADEYARLQLVAYEKVKGLAETAPEEETGLSLRSSAAEETAFNARKAAGLAQAESAEADRDLAEVRGQLTEAERQLDAARKAAQAPAGTAPISDVTIKACASFLMTDEVWGALSLRDRQRVHFLAEPRAVSSLAECLAARREASTYDGSALWAAGSSAGTRPPARPSARCSTARSPWRRPAAGPASRLCGKLRLPTW